MFEVCLSTIVSLYATHYWFNRLHTIVPATVETYLCWNCHPTFVFLIIIRYSAGTHVTSIISYSDFTSKSPNYVLSKAGFVFNQAKPLNFAILQDRQKVTFFSSLARNHEIISAHMRWGKRLRAIVAQSWNSWNAQCNLEIAQILRLHETYIYIHIIYRIRPLRIKCLFELTRSTGKFKASNCWVYY